MEHQEPLNNTEINFLSFYVHSSGFIGQTGTPESSFFNFKVLEDFDLRKYEYRIINEEQKRMLLPVEPPSRGQYVSSGPAFLVAAYFLHSDGKFISQTFVTLKGKTDGIEPEELFVEAQRYSEENFILLKKSERKDKESTGGMHLGRELSLFRKRDPRRSVRVMRR